jgi:hypothetical protein
MRKITTIFAAAALVLAALFGGKPAAATTISNQSSWDGSTFIWSFGAPDTTSYGEIFRAAGTTLDSFSFLISTMGNVGNAKFVLAAWDGTKATGPALYESSPFALNASGTYEWNAVNGINAALTIGARYIAYLTTAGVADPIVATRWAAANDNGGLGGAFAFANSDGADPLVSLASWTVRWSSSDVIYEASFSGVAEAPLPAALPLFASALGGLGVAAWRRRRPARM